MKASISRNDALSLIESSAEDGPVALQYCRKDGSIATMVVRKSRSGAKVAGEQGSAKGQYMIRNAGLIRVIDQANQQPKSLLIFAICGFSPSGSTHKQAFYPVTHGS